LYLFFKLFIKQGINVDQSNSILNYFKPYPRLYQTETPYIFKLTIYLCYTKPLCLTDSIENIKSTLLDGTLLITL